MRLAVAASLLAACGILATCATGPIEPTTPRPERASADDLLSLVPESAHVLIRFDLRRMRRFWQARPWTRSLRTAAAGRRLHAALGEDLLRHADVLVVALWLDVSGVGRILMLARGPRTEGLGLAARARRALEGRGSGRSTLRSPPRRKVARWTRYRDIDVADSRGAATALLTPFAVATGAGTTVRQAMDLLAGLPGRSSAREDRVLMALWRLVAGAGAGRKPLMAAVARLTPRLRARVQARLGLPGPVHRLGLRLSGGSWLTLRAFVDVAGRSQGRAVVRALHGWVQRLVATRLGRRLELARLLDPLTVHHEGGRVHLQWAVPTERLDRHGRILAPVLRILGGGAPAAGRPAPSPSGP
jgi:hypothetical protein